MTATPLPPQLHEGTWHPRVVSTRRISWSLLVLALLCLVPVAGGVGLLFTGSETGLVVGLGLVGFFGSGVVVLTRKALTPR